MSRVFVTSITELCRADHGDDPEIIAQWTANKTPDDMRQWLQQPGVTMLVADEDDSIACVGGFSGAQIMTLYVAPEARFRGVSGAMLRHMERAMLDGGVTTGKLTSTGTAHRFYLARGWRDSGPPDSHFGVVGFPMSKDLRAPEAHSNA